MTRLIVAIILMSTCRLGPAVSLKGSPTVSPVTAALCASLPLPAPHSCTQNCHDTFDLPAKKVAILLLTVCMEESCEYAM